MKIGEYCKHAAVVIDASADIAAAAELMRARHVGFLVVVAEQGRCPVGVITDRDIVVQVAAKSIDPGSLLTRDVMTRNPVTVPDNEDVVEVLELMRRNGIRRAPVIDVHGSVIGVVALDDVVEFIAGLLDQVTGLIVNEQRKETRTRLTQ